MPLGKWNSSKIWEGSKLFVSIAQGYHAKLRLSLPYEICKERDVNKRNIIQNKVFDRIYFNYIQGKAPYRMLNIRVNIKWNELLVTNVTGSIELVFQ